MKPSTLIASLALATVAHAIPAQLTATLTFAGSEWFGYGPSPGREYQEGGITFASATDFRIIGGNFGGVLFGGGGYSYAGTALNVLSQDWVTVTAGGADIDAVSFRYGHDWNLYAIEAGVMTTALDWQTWQDGVQVSAGTFGQSTGHGGNIVTIGGDAPFDTLLIASHATTYASAVWNWQINGWVRGAPTTTAANHIAFDDVTVTLEPAPQMQFALFSLPAIPSAPDGGSTLALFIAALLGLGVMRRWL